SLAQDRLLDRVQIVKVALQRGADHCAELVARAHPAGATVVAEHTDTTERLETAQAIGSDLLQGPMFHRDPPVTRRSFSAGE
uniref:EAL domain-containing protein n=1 Tax=Cellulomonas sp. GbtcB1 TaxID=2824746 RepID=UPI001C301CF6